MTSCSCNYMILSGLNFYCVKNSPHTSRHSGWCGSELTFADVAAAVICKGHLKAPFSRFYHFAVIVPFLRIYLMASSSSYIAKI